MIRSVLLLRVVALIALLIGTGHSLHRWAILPLRCIHAASLGATALEAASERHDYVLRRVAIRVREDLHGCQCISPPEARVHFALGAASETAGDRPSAIAEYQRALLIGPRPEIYFRLGLAQLDALDRAAAIENLTQACAFAPALVSEIPYDDVRQEVERRVRATYGADWIPHARQPSPKS